MCVFILNYKNKKFLIRVNTSISRIFIFFGSIDVKYINPSTGVNSSYTKIPNYLLKNYNIRLTDIQRSFLFYVWGNIHSKSGSAELSLADVTRTLGYSKSKTIRVRNELINLGLIHTVMSKNRDGGNGKTRYFLIDVENEEQVQFDSVAHQSEHDLQQDLFIKETKKEDKLVLNSKQRDCAKFKPKECCEFDTSLQKEHTKKKFKKEKQQQQYNSKFSKNIGGVFIKNISENNKLQQDTTHSTYNNFDKCYTDVTLDEVKTTFPNNDNGNVFNTMDELMKRNISPEIANKLVQKHKPDLIITYIKYTDFMIKNNKIKNPAAFLVSALKNKYNVSSFLEHATKEKHKKKMVEQNKSIQHLLEKQEENSKQEKMEILKASELFKELPDKHKHKLDKLLEKEVNKRYDNPLFGRQLCKDIVLKELAIECNWQLIDFVKHK